VLLPSSILPPLFISLRFNSCKDIFGAPFESVITPNLILHFFFKNCVRRAPHTSTLHYVAECLNATVMVLLTLFNLPSTPHADNVQTTKSPFQLTQWSCTAHQDVRHFRTPRTITIMFTKSYHGKP